MTDVSIREGRPEDAAALRRLVAEVVEMPDSVHPVEPAAAGEVVFVAEVSGHPAGYAAVRVDAADLVVDRILVAPADRGRAVGNRLLDWLEGYGTSCGLRRVRIAVADADRTARDFYARRGYTSAGDCVCRDLTRPPE